LPNCFSMRDTASVKDRCLSAIPPFITGLILVDSVDLAMYFSIDYLL